MKEYGITLRIAVIKRILIATGFCAGLLPISSVFAHAETSSQQEKWDPVSAGPVTTWTSPLCGEARLAVQPFLFYNRTRGTFDSHGHYDSLPNNDRKYQYQQQLFMQYGLTERLEIDGQVTYQQNYVRQNSAKAHSQGIGDSYLFLRYCIIEDDQEMPHLTGIFQLKIPSGKYENLDPGKLGTDAMGAASGGGSYDHGYGFILTKKLKPFVLHFDAIYSLPTEREIDGIRTLHGQYLNYDFGVEYFPGGGFNLMLELNGFLQRGRKEDGEKISSSGVEYLTISPGIGWSNDIIQMLLAYQRTLAGKNTDANDSIVFTLVHTF